MHHCMGRSDVAALQANRPGRTCCPCELQVAAKDKRLVEMGLQAIYDHEDTFAEARGEGDEVDENGDARPAKKQKKADTPDAKARSITSFFKAGGTTD